MNPSLSHVPLLGADVVPDDPPLDVVDVVDDCVVEANE